MWEQKKVSFPPQFDPMSGQPLPYSYQQQLAAAAAHGQAAQAAAYAQAAAQAASAGHHQSSGSAGHPSGPPPPYSAYAQAQPLSSCYPPLPQDKQQQQQQQQQMQQLYQQHLLVQAQAQAAQAAAQQGHQAVVTSHGYYPMAAAQPQYHYNPYPQLPANSTVVMPSGFDAGARFDGISRATIPPAPPGVVPNPAQLAMMQGQGGNVVVGQKKGSWMSGGSSGGYTFW